MYKICCEDTIDVDFGWIVERLNGASLYGVKIDTENVTHLVVGAYFLGMNDRLQSINKPNDKLGEDK